MRYATKSRGRKYVKRYGFLSFARNLASSAAAREAAKRARDTLVRQGKEGATKAGRRALSKTAEATGDLVGQKIADKITGKTKKKQTAELVHGANCRATCDQRI